MRCCCGLAISYLQPLFSRPHLDITCIKFLEYYQLHVYKTCIKTTPWKQRKFHISFLVKSFWEIVILDKCFCKLSFQTTFFFANWCPISNTMKLKGLQEKMFASRVGLIFAHQELEETLDLASSVILKLLWQHDNQAKVLGIKMMIVSW